MEPIETEFRIHTAHDTLKHALLSYSEQLKAVHSTNEWLDVEVYRGTFKRTASVIWGPDEYSVKHPNILEKDINSVLPVRNLDGGYRPDSTGLHRAQYKGLVELAILATGLSRELTFKLIPTEEDNVDISPEAIFERAKNVRARLVRREYDTFFAPGRVLDITDDTDELHKRNVAQQFGRRTWGDFRGTFYAHKSQVDEVIEKPQDMFPKTANHQRYRFDLLNRLIVLAASSPEPQDLVANFPKCESDQAT